ncbi:hypothetical protein [Streptomyces sp. NPDC020965]|uniref:hypothetical protein n=1 Tax=Streptomyces sp. NPDC020965 TaxID=3365105 RepID=UPI0037A49F4F
MTRSKRMLPYALMRTAAVFALSAGVATPALITAPAAYAAESGALRTQDRVYHPVTLADGRVNVHWPSQLAASVRVTVLESTEPGAAVLASTDDLSWHDNDPSISPQGWITAEPLRLPEGTPLGRYPVVVTEREADGTETEWVGGRYAYLARASISQFGWDREYTDHENRTAALSGLLTMYNPFTKVRTPARGVRLHIALSNGVRDESKMILTGSDGTFTLPVTAEGTVTAIRVWHHESTELTPIDSLPGPTLPARTMSYRITADADRTRVKPGGEFTMSGRVERLTKDGWRPFAGVPVLTSSRLSGGGPLGKGRSAADGSFSYPAKAEQSGGKVYTLVEPSPYFTSTAHDSTQIHVPVYAVFQDTEITLDPFGAVKAGAVLNVASRCEAQPVALQSSTDGKNWRTLRAGTTDPNCRVSITAPGQTGGRYRIHHPESDEFVEMSSPAVRLNRVPTRFTGGKLTPVRPAKNGTLTSTGTLQRQVNGVWRPYVGGKVTLFFKARGETRWKAVTKGKSASGGAYTLKGGVSGDGTWSVRTDLATGYFYSETKGTYVDAR